MGKFVMECPKCHNYVEAGSGFFSKRKINCSCGHVIDVRTEKMTSKKCPHCGNQVVYDQSKGADARCPICHEQVNAGNEVGNVQHIFCTSCSCMLNVDKNAEIYTCPLCEVQINVQKQIAKQRVKDQGLASVIKYEGGNDVLVWKHPIEDFNMGSQLIVHETQEAIFFKDGRALDLFGPGRYTLATQNLPILKDLYQLPMNNDQVFHSEVYFINRITQMGIKWGTDSKVKLFDPASGIYVEIGACGNFNLQINDSRKLLIKLVGTTNTLNQNELIEEAGASVKSVTGKFKALVMNKVKSNLAQTIKEKKINILEIDAYLDELSESLRVLINKVLDEYGLVMPEFYITCILTPDDDPNFKRLKQQFADKTLKVREEEIRKVEAEAAQERKIVEAQTSAQLKMVSAKADAETIKMHAEAEAQAYRMQAQAEAEAMRMKGFSYQQETARQVSLEAMKNGITGNGGTNGVGDLAGIGMTLGAMGGVINMTKEAIAPIMENGNATGNVIGETVNNLGLDSWNCSCGVSGIRSKFCPECGAKRPVSNTLWECKCGQKGIVSKFCPECGSKRQDV